MLLVVPTLMQHHPSPRSIPILPLVVGGFLLLVITSTLSQASQLVSIEGRVVDETGHPLEGTNVSLSSRQSGTVTNRLGHFQLQVAPGDTLLVTHMGFASQSVPLGEADSPSSLTIQLQPVTLRIPNTTVTAARKAQSRLSSHHAVGVVDESALSRQGPGSTADVLQGAPGVAVQKTTPGHGTPIVRGLIGKNILVLYNGIRLNPPTLRPGGNQTMSTIGSDGLDRIEILRGPASALYGSEAVGGVVQMIRRPPQTTEHTEWTSEASFRARSADLSARAHAGLRGASQRASVAAGFSAATYGDLAPGGNGPSQRPTAYNEWSAYGTGRYDLGPRRRLVGDVLVGQQSQVPRYDQVASGAFDTYVYDPQDRLLAALHIIDEDPGYGITALEATASMQREREGRTTRRTNSETTAIEEDHISTGGVFLQATAIPKGRHVLRLALEGYGSGIGSDRKESSSTGTVTVRGAFPDGSQTQSTGILLSDDIAVSENTELGLSVRRSDAWLAAPAVDSFGAFDAHYSDITGHVSINHRWRTGLHGVASIGRAFRAPNLNDTVALKATSSGVDAPATGLRPESSTGFELGLIGSIDIGNWEIFIYHNEFQDLIVERPGTYLGIPFLDENGNGRQDEGEPPIEVKVNADHAFISGMEAATSLGLGSSWTVDSAITWTYGHNRSDGVPMRRIPPLGGHLEVTRDFGSWLFGGRTQFSASQRRLSPGDQDDPRIASGGTDSWLDAGLFTTFQSNALEWTLFAGNLFDARYRPHGSGVDRPGRHVTLSMQWRGS